MPNHRAFRSLRRGLLWHLVFGSLLVACSVSEAHSIRFDLRDVGLRNLVYFISEGKLQKTIGISHALSGWLELDPDRVGDGVHGEMEVDLRTFETKLDSVNSNLKTGASAAEYPLARFTISRLVTTSANQLADGQPVTLRLTGSLTLKGVSRSETVLAKLVYFRESDATKQRLPGNLLRFSSSFDLDLEAYRVAIPADQKMDFSRYLQVFADATGTDHSPSAVLATVPPAPADDASKSKDPKKAP